MNLSQDTARCNEHRGAAIYLVVVGSSAVLLVVQLASVSIPRG
jgi:hypothetical protein